MSEINQASAMLDAMIQVREKVKKMSLELEQAEAKNRELEAKLEVAKSVIEEIKFHEDEYTKSSPEDSTYYLDILTEALEKLRGEK